jgi:hypothetical protein
MRECTLKPAIKNVTLLLKQLSGGHQDVVSELVPLLYDELQRLASYYHRRERRQPYSAANGAGS